MQQPFPWIIPSKYRGDAVKRHTHHWDSHLIQAAQEIAAEESAKYGRKISGMTLIATLATQRGEFYTEMRKRLNQRMKGLKKEYQRNERERHDNERAKLGL
jgi:hypothetical protein